jgi:hypothetical protein
MRPVLRERIIRNTVKVDSTLDLLNSATLQEQASHTSPGHPIMLASMKTSSIAAAALLLIAAITPSAAAEEGTWQVEFTVQLKKGVKGSFVVEVHPDW